MRFTIAAATLFASAVMAIESTTYVTVEFTKTQCAATVTDCPARSTVTSTSSYPVVTSSTESSSSPVTSAASSSSAGVTIYSTTPIGTTTASLKPVYSANSTSSAGPTAPVVASSKAPVPSVVTVTVNSCPAASSLSTVPAVPFSTKAVIASTGVASVPVGTGVASASVGTGIPSPSSGASNGTVVVPSITASKSATASTPAVATGAASALSGSVFFAGAAGLAAVLFA